MLAFIFHGLPLEQPPHLSLPLPPVFHLSISCPSPSDLSAQVFNPAINQDAIFDDTKHLVQSAVDGYNVCIFAYGQTGSGKTFTVGSSRCRDAPLSSFRSCTFPNCITLNDADSSPSPPSRYATADVEMHHCHCPLSDHAPLQLRHPE